MEREMLTVAEALVAICAAHVQGKTYRALNCTLETGEQLEIVRAGQGYVIQRVDWGVCYDA